MCQCRVPTLGSIRRWSSCIILQARNYSINRHATCMSQQRWHSDEGQGTMRNHASAALTHAMFSNQLTSCMQKTQDRGSLWGVISGSTECVCSTPGRLQSEAPKAPVLQYLNNAVRNTNVTLHMLFERQRSPPQKKTHPSHRGHTTTMCLRSQPC